MISEIPVPQKDQFWTALCPPVIAMARAINGLRKLEFVQSADSDWHFHWEAGGAKIEYPDSGGGAANEWWIVAIDGQPMYCQFASGTPVASLPAGATLVNPS